MSNLNLSPGVAKLYRAATRSRGAGPPTGPRKTRRFSRCVLHHEGQQIMVDLTTAKSCPPGFTGLGIPGGGFGRVVSVRKKAAKKTAAKKTTRKKAPKKKAAKKRAAKKATRKKAPAKKNGALVAAAARARLAKLYKARKLGEASKLRAKMRKAGIQV